jgi:hypothetical protein
LEHAVRIEPVLSSAYKTRPVETEEWRQLATPGTFGLGRFADEPVAEIVQCGEPRHKSR